MNLALLRWLRLVAPPTWIIVTLLAWCGVMEGIYGWIGWQWGWQAIQPSFFVARDAACLAAAAYLGAYRSVAFHPLFDSEYLNWLALTPWRYDKPLPRGPLHLVPQDALFVGLIAALMLHEPVVPPVLVPLVFLIAYYLILSVSLWWADLRHAGYGLSALVGLVIVTAYQSPPAALGLAGLCYILVYAAIRHSLAAFPWTARSAALRKGIARQWQVLSAGHRQHGTVSLNLEFPETEVHWPFNQLHALQRPPFFQKDDRLAIALLTGWWTWVLFSSPGGELFAVAMGPMLYVSLLGFVIMARLSTYCLNVRPPISLWGRIATLRWIIPGYDRVYLTPLATLGLGIVFPIALAQLQLAPSLVLGLSIPPFLIAALLGGPSLSQWRLTSPARLVPGVRNQQLVEEI